MAATVPPIVAALPPLTYLEHYSQLQDVLQGNYALLFAIHHPITGQPSNTIFDTIIDSSNTIPKVFLAVVSTPDGSNNVIALHNPWHFKPSLVAAATPWDGKTFAFIGDIQPISRFICTVSFPDDLFDTVQEQCVQTTNSSPPHTMLILNPVADTVPSTNLITTRAIIPVLHQYVNLVLSCFPLSPRAAWQTLVSTIIADNNDIPCAPLLDWLRIATAKCFDTDGTIIMAPANHLGLLDTALPPVIDDPQLAEQRWSAIIRDLPALDIALSVTYSASATSYHTIVGCSPQQTRC